VFHADWDNARQGKANSVVGFHETLNEFISYHFSNTDLIDQKNMLAKAKKPFKYTVEVLCSRLRHLNKLMSKLLETHNTLPYDEGALKIELFKMMLSDWQINFNNTGLNIADDAHTLQCLVHFMTVQEVTPGMQAECDYITSSSQSSPSGWRTCDIPTRSSRQPGFAGAHSGARWRCRGQLPLRSIQAYTTGRCVSPIHMGLIISQVSIQVCQGAQPGEDLETVRAAGDSRIAIKMSISQKIL
jgi:hypothetical protein